MFTAPWHFLKGIFKAEGPILKTGFWAVKLTGFNVGKVNLIEKESNINNSCSIAPRPLMRKSLVYEDLVAAPMLHILPCCGTWGLSLKDPSIASSNQIFKLLDETQPGRLHVDQQDCSHATTAGLFLLLSLLFPQCTSLIAFSSSTNLCLYIYWNWHLHTEVETDWLNAIKAVAKNLWLYWLKKNEMSSHGPGAPPLCIGVSQWVSH